MMAEMSAGSLASLPGEAAMPATEPTSYVHFDVCPTWLELAIRHLSDAQVAQAARVEAWKGADENARAGALQWEFEASLQAIVAAATAIDALYAAVRPKVKLPQLLVDNGERSARRVTFRSLRSCGGHFHWGRGLPALCVRTLARYQDSAFW